MKITKEMKANIVRDVLKFKFKAAEDKIAEMRTVFADALYAHFYGKDEAQARAMPKRWFAYDDTIRITCASYSYNYVVNLGTHIEPKDDVVSSILRMTKDRPFPACEKEVKIDDKHPLWRQSQEIVKAHVKMMKDRTELRRKMYALLASCNTLKQLEAAWPEGKRFYPDEVKNYAVVPVGLSDQINKALGLPEKASTATAAVRKAASTHK